MYDAGDQEFHVGPENDIVLDAEGREWRVTESHLIGPDDQRRPRIAGHLAYWFGWYAMHPETELYDGVAAESSTKN